MATCNRDMVKTLNQRLAAKGNPNRIIEKDYDGVVYTATISIDSHDAQISPLLVEKIVFTNLSTVEQEMTSNISKEIKEYQSWSITGGTKVGASVEMEAGAFFAKASASASAEVSLEAGKVGGDEETVTISKDVGLRIPPHTASTMYTNIAQEDAKDVGFAVTSVLQHAPFEFVPVLVPKFAQVHRFFHTKLICHYYTTVPAEADAWRKIPDVNDETAAASPGYVYVEQQPDTIPVYRFKLPDHSDFVLTTDPAEAEDLRNKHQWQELSILGYVYAAPQTDTVPLCRFYYEAGGDHLYTTAPDELAAARSNPLVREETAPGFIYREPPASEKPHFNIEDLLEQADRTFTTYGAFDGTAFISEVTIDLHEQPLKEFNDDFMPVQGVSGAQAMLNTAVLDAPLTETAVRIHVGEVHRSLQVHSN